MDELLLWLHNIKDKKILKNKTLIEITRYRNFAFWWFVHIRMYYDLRMHLKSKKRFYKPSFKKRVANKLGFIYFIYIISIALLTKLLFRPTSYVQKRIGVKKIFLTAQFGAWKEIRDPLSKKVRKGHVIFDPILTASLKKAQPPFQFISSYPFAHLFIHNFKTAIEIAKSKYLGDFKPLEYYFSWEIIKRLIIAKKYFSEVWKKLKKSNEVSKKLVYRKIRVFDVFRDYFEYYYKIYLPIMVLYFELSLHALKIEKPNLVMMINEYGGFERALLFASYQLKIPTLAMQHGIIHKYHPGYMYTRKEISKNGSANFPYVPIPTKTVVYGPYYKDLLTRISAYPENNVIVTGQPRYDILCIARKIYSREKFCNRYNLDPTKKIVLIATQPFQLENIRTEFFANTISALKKINGIQVVVKPHHNENPDWHKKKLRELNAKAIILPPKSDTYEAIYSCDLFISVTSTTILEALILNKTVVVVNISKLPEVLPWVKEKAALGVYNPDMILTVIKNALFDKTYTEQLIINRSTFVYKHTYKNDGRATERVIEVINSLLNKKCR